MSAISLQLGIYRISPTTKQRVRQFGVAGPQGILGELVYSWSTSEDVYTGIVEEAERRSVIDQIESFNDEQSDAESSMTRLLILTEQLEKISQGETWVPAKFIQSKSEFAGDTRFSPTLAFAHHLRWVCETFKHTPNLIVVFG